MIGTVPTGLQIARDGFDPIGLGAHFEHRSAHGRLMAAMGKGPETGQAIVEYDVGNPR